MQIIIVNVWPSYFLTDTGNNIEGLNKKVYSFMTIFIYILQGGILIGLRKGFQRHEINKT